MADLSPLVDTEVRQVILDDAVTLLLVDGPANRERVRSILQIEAPFSLEADPGAWLIVPNDKRTHGPVARLLHLNVASARMDDDQTLRVGFSDGSAITVQRDSEYESWTLTGTGVPQILVSPAGLRIEQ